MSELESLFPVDQPEAETVEEVSEVPQDVEEVSEDRPPMESTEPSDSDENTEEKTHEPEKDEADTSKKDDTKPALKRVNLALDDKEFDLELPEEIADHLKNGILMENHFRKNTQKLAEKERQFEAESQERRQQQEAALTELGSQLLFMQKEFESEEMQQLAKFDRDAYNARKLEYQEKFATYKKFVDQEIEAEERKAAEFKREYERKQTELVPQLLPEWMDESTKKEDAKKIMDYASSLGFTLSEMKGMKSAMLMRVFRDAMLHDTVKAKVSSKLKKPATTPVKASSKPDSTKEKTLEELLYGG